MKAATFPRPQSIRAPLRSLFAFINVGAGIIPSLAFFVWIERNASLPYVGIEWGWPWISFLTWPTPVLAAWNIGLFFVFGWLHSLFAQPKVHRVLERIIPLQAIRTVYLAITGLSLLALMGFWQNTGIVIWLVSLPLAILNAVSFLIFWFLMGANGYIMSRFDPLHFIGLKQIYQSSKELERTAGNPELLTTGIFRRVRHPIYTLTILAVMLTPIMTLDRLLIALSMALYLGIAIPIEERKLIRIFGSAYDDYRKKVPAVIPRLGRVS